jgi:hypothetical protein
MRCVKAAVPEKDDVQGRNGVGRGSAGRESLRQTPGRGLAFEPGGRLDGEPPELAADLRDVAS